MATACVVGKRRGLTKASSVSAHSSLQAVPQSFQDPRRDSRQIHNKRTGGLAQQYTSNTRRVKSVRPAIQHTQVTAVAAQVVWAGEAGQHGVTIFSYLAVGLTWRPDYDPKQRATGPLRIALLLQSWNSPG
jgi:hypothetical protein